MIRRLLLAGATVLGVGVFAGTGAFEDHTHRDDHGVIDRAGGVGVRQMHIGDCIQLPLQTLVESVEGVPCAEPHDAQVYAQFELVGGHDLTELQVDELVQQGCIERWQQAIGTDFRLDRELGMKTFQPPQDQWLDGDRAAGCVVVALDGTRLAGSHVPADNTPGS